jgi:hypothetical protein
VHRNIFSLSDSDGITVTARSLIHDYENNNDNVCSKIWRKGRRKLI